MSETTFSHQKANSPDAAYSHGGLRSFFVYRDTGINVATKGSWCARHIRVRRQKAAPAFIFTLRTFMSFT